jgi:hypothetical protein
MAVLDRVQVGHARLHHREIVRDQWFVEVPAIA